MTHYDALVIGSGIGGLTCGAFLARSGMRVCVLEKHSRIGGYAHNFKRRQFTFESGIHSVPMAKGGLIDHLLTLLGVAQQIETIELPEMYHVRTPQWQFTMPSRRELILPALLQQFPHEATGLESYFSQLQCFEQAIIEPIYRYEERFGGEDIGFVSQFHNLSYAQNVQRYLHDDLLQQALYGQWPYGGGSADWGSALFYTMMYLFHYRDGTHCLKGGFATLAQALSNAITARGGCVLSRRQVAGCIVDNGRTSGVHCLDGEQFSADRVISNVSPYLLHRELLPAPARSRRWLRRLSNLSPSVSAVAVYCGLRTSIEDLLPQATTFWFDDRPQAEIFNRILADDHHSLDHLILLRSLPQTHPAPTLTLLYFVNDSASPDWKNDKQLFAQRMLQRAEELYPGLRERIELTEVGSPRTFERYTANTRGALYGFANTKDMYGEAKMPIRTHIPNLYQTGHWGKPGCGVINVMYNGYMTALTILAQNQQA